MHKEIFSSEQFALLNIVKSFSVDFGLVGGTAIALHLGHRESIDFDLFTFAEFENQKIRRKISRVVKINAILRDETGQFTLVINGVRFTFLHFPYKVDFSESLDDIIKLPDLLTLAAMKAFALGRRAKWKDYVDLYFVLKANHSVAEITEKGVEIFGSEFNEKIFRTQLAYFKDIDYSEQVVYKDGFSTSDETIKKALVDFSLEQEAEYK
jgi:hypothetical protein